VVDEEEFSVDRDLAQQLGFDEGMEPCRGGLV
jgi:hypothetical protein